MEQLVPRCEYDPHVNFALQQNDVPVIRLLAIDNPGDARRTDLEVRVSSDPPVFEPWSTSIASIDGGASYNLRQPPLALSAERLAAQREGEAGRIRVEVLAGTEPAGSATLPFEILAYNEWSGLRAPPELLAAFVLPNQPAVATVLKRARPHMEKLAGDPALDGYQSRSRERVVAMTGSIFAAIQELGVTYVNPPASFEQVGQKIRLPDQLLGEQMGTCLDLTVLAAACLEQAGLHPFLVVVAGHAFPGVWLDEFSLPEPAIGDPTAVRKRVDGEEALVFDSSAIAQKATFKQAVTIGRRYLEDDDAFLCAIDVKRARRAHVRPLPIRHTATGWEAIPEPSARAGESASEPTLPQLHLPTADEDVAAESPRTRLERWKGKLLDLTLRNRLLNVSFNRKSVIPLATFDIGSLEDVLAGGAELSLAPRPDESEVMGPRSSRLMEQRVGEEALQAYLAAGLDQKRVFAALPPGDLDKRLTHLYREARTALEETGSNTLYLALGFLSWFETDGSDTERLAPLVLLPVELIRGSARQPFKLKATDDDPRINVTLLKKLQAEFGLDVRGLDDMPEDASGLDIPRILARFRRAVMDMPRWDVRAMAAISEFSFAKYMMWVDLEDRTDTLLANPLFGHIMQGEGAPYPLVRELVTPASIDAERGVEDDLCVVDADSSQLTAIFAAKDGNSFVLQGPPGTGKSQTITNLIAQLLGDGKTVLFVSEKMAALEVVHHRLRRAGLGEFCLELHSNKSNKGEVVKQMAAPVELAGKRTESDWERRAQQVHGLRASLNHFADALHRPGPYGDSVFTAASAMLRYKSAPEVRLGFRHRDEVSTARVERLRAHIEALEVAARDIGEPLEHPWSGVPRSTWTPRTERAVEEAIDASLARAREVGDAARQGAEALGLGLPATTDDVLTRLDRAADVLLTSPGPARALLETRAWSEERRRVEGLGATVRARQQTWAEIDGRFADGLLSMDVETLERRFARWAGAFFLLAFFMLWSARRALKRVSPDGRLPSNQVIRDDLARAVKVKALDADIAARAGQTEGLLGNLWEGLDTDWDRVGQTLRWVEAYRSMRLDLTDGMSGALLREGDDAERLLALATEQRELLAPQRPRGQALRRFREIWAAYGGARRALAELLDVGGAPGTTEARLGDLPIAIARLEGWRGAMKQLREWCAWRDAMATAGGDGALAALLEAHADGRVPGPSLLPSFERALGTWWMEEALGSDPALREFRGTSHDALIERFRKLDLEMQAIAREEVRARLAARVPPLGAPGEMAVLRRELKKQRRHMPVRKLISSLPHNLTKLKPCLLMSPLSVAQYLDPGLAPFDVVVFDEASQIPPWDAVGAIARGRQMVVVGDSRQLPPTSFFQKSDDEAPDDDDMEELESILDECVSAGFLSLWLEWHYRSRHEALIAFSNHHYYDNRLHTFPAAAQDVPDLGVKWRPVPEGFYDKGRSRTNQAEAVAVVAELARRLADPALCRKSLGVVTFSQAQQTLILDLLDKLRRERPELEPFFNESEAVREPVFVKNLENVQGDERDVMLFSICYGPDRAGKVAMNFGPLNRDGGERRLNVAITRARELLVVFSTLTPDQIDLARTQALGVTHLKTFLDYAKRGVRAINEAVALDPTADFDSPFEAEVCRWLSQDGWQVDLQVGCAGYRIDLGVKDPDRPGSYLLGVECDGATYHSARSARDRDRIRQTVLEGLGWKLFRIWSLDWWHDPARVMARLRQALEDALERARNPKEAADGATAGARQAAPPPPAPVVDVDALLESDSAQLTLPDHAVEYRLADTPELGPREKWDDPAILPQVATRLVSVVSSEGPIHVDEATRRIGASWGAAKATSRSVDKVLSAIPRVNAAARPVRRGDWLWPAGTDPASWRVFRTHPNTETRRAAEHVPPEEVANAAEWLVSHAGSIDAEELVIELARVFGYRSTGKKVRAAMEAGIEHLERRGRVERADGVVRHRPS